MDGWWTCQDKRLDIFFTKILGAGLDKTSHPWRMVLPFLQSVLFNFQTRSGGMKVVNKHYNLSSEFYDTFLDKEYKKYSCAFFESDEKTLEQAQENCLELSSRKIYLSSEDTVLDIGCGNGGFAKFAATKFGCYVSGINISKEQIKSAKEMTAALPVEIKFMNYLDLGKGKFTKVVSFGMVEHVGYKNYREFMEKAHDSLSDGGLFLLHTIAGVESTTHTDSWIDKYIFPNSMLPSLKQLTKAAEGLFVIEDIHNLGPNYDMTLMRWNERFQRNWSTIKSWGYDERFHRMWEYYLLMCAGGFRARKLQLYQLVLAKNPKDGYIPVR